MPVRPIDRGTLDDCDLLAAIRARDEAGFEDLVRRYHASMLRLARSYVPSDAVAEEVVQETWMGVLEGIDRFEGRSSLKTWIFRILLNIARTRGVREHRCVPVSSLLNDEDAGPAEWFFSEHSRVFAGWWVTHPARWDGSPEDRVEADEVRRLVTRAIDELPPAQRTVIVLRDVEQFSSDETCALLDLSEGNQRVLLHRARLKVRKALAAYFERRPL